MNNKKYSTLYTIIALLLLAQPAYSQQLEKRVYPSELVGGGFHYKDKPTLSSKFSWRWIKGERGNHRVVTIENGNADTTGDGDNNPIYETSQHYPCSYLNTKDGFFDQISLENSFLGIESVIRDSKTFQPYNPLYYPKDADYYRNGQQNKFRILVIVEYGPPHYNRFSGNQLEKITPYNLVGTNNYRSEISESTKFNYKYVQIENGQRVRALTLED